MLAKVITTIFLSFLLSLSVLAQNNQSEDWMVNKKGGVIFRVTGAHPLDMYNEYASLFQEREKNFSFTIGLGGYELAAEGYPEGIRVLQDQGNELLDPTPNYKTNYFITIQF